MRGKCESRDRAEKTELSRLGDRGSNGRCTKSVSSEPGLGRCTGVRQHNIWQDQTPDLWSRWPPWLVVLSVTFKNFISQLLNVTVMKNCWCINAVGMICEVNRKVKRKFRLTPWFFSGFYTQEKWKLEQMLVSPTSQRHYTPWPRGRNVQMSQ